MDEEMVDFVREAFEGGEIDMDYEFDAPRFYDFTWPKTGREAEEAEEWFLSAGGYQPSLAKKLRKLDEKSQNSPPPTKRHKLEAGYVRKVAEQLKHQHLWSHKVSKKVGADAARPKVTVPKEPNLEANRAQRRIRLMPNQENNQKFSGLLHGLALKSSQFQQQSFR